MLNSRGLLRALVIGAAGMGIALAPGAVLGSDVARAESRGPRSKKPVAESDYSYTIRTGYLRHSNGSAPKDRRAAVKARNRLRAKGRHRKAVR